MRRWMILLIVPMLVGGAALTNSAFAHNDLCHTLGTCPPHTPPPPTPTPGPMCSQIGTIDYNPTNAHVAPALGQVVIARRTSDNRIPIGFNDQTPRLATNHVAYTTHAKQASLIDKAAGEGALGRWGLAWNVIEPTQNAAYNWTDFDKLYCAQLAEGIRPILGLGETPPWADGYASSECVNGCRVPPAEAYFADFQDVLEAAVIRYPQAAAFGAWNEPNLFDFWGSTPDPVSYAKLLRAAYKAIKNGNPNMKVIAGALSNVRDNTATSMNMSTFGPAFLGYQFTDDNTYGRDWLEAFSFHPYPLHLAVSPTNHAWQHFDSTNVDTMAIGRTVINNAYQTGPKPRLIIDEVGAYGYQNRALSSGSGEPQHLSQADQDATMQYIYNKLNQSTDVDAMIVHTTSEPATSGYPPAQPDTFGWTYKDLLGNYQPKLVYCSFAAMLATPVNCNQPV